MPHVRDSAEMMQFLERLAVAHEHNTVVRSLVPGRDLTVPVFMGRRVVKSVADFELALSTYRIVPGCTEACLLPAVMPVSCRKPLRTGVLPRPNCFFPLERTCNAILRLAGALRNTHYR